MFRRFYFRPIDKKRWIKELSGYDDVISEVKTSGHFRIDLQNLLSKGSRCVMFYLIQRMDAVVFKPADRIDPAYARMVRQAVRNGVEIMAYRGMIFFF